MNKLLIDELNILRADLEQRAKTDGRLNEDDAIDSVYDLLIMAYVYGTNQTNDDIGTSIEPNLDSMQTALDKRYDGKGFRERVREYAADNDVEKIMRVAETDAHRIFNAAQFDTALESGLPLQKQWITQMDDKVRETHDYLLFQTVPLNEDFYTYDGDHSPYPGYFTMPDNNVNCRCYLRFSTAE